MYLNLICNYSFKIKHKLKKKDSHKNFFFLKYLLKHKTYTHLIKYFVAIIIFLLLI